MPEKFEGKQFDIVSPTLKEHPEIESKEKELSPGEADLKVDQLRELSREKAEIGLSFSS